MTNNIQVLLDDLVKDNKIKYVKRWEYDFDEKRMKWMKYYSMVSNK